MVFEIYFAESVADQLRTLTAAERSRVLDAVARRLLRSLFERRATASHCGRIHLLPGSCVSDRARSGVTIAGDLCRRAQG